MVAPLIIRTVDTACCFPRHCPLLVSGNRRVLDRNQTWKALPINIQFIPAHAIASHLGSLKSSALCSIASLGVIPRQHLLDEVHNGIGDMIAFP